MRDTYRADPDAHQWLLGGAGLLGDTVPDEALAEWGRKVWAELAEWDEWRPAIN